LKPTALRYALSLPGISGVVVGLHDEAELRQTVAWMKSLGRLTEEELTAIEKPTRELAVQWHEIYGPLV
jgi:predicted aldo/keto reductase-like oxidoreductase